MNDTERPAAHPYAALTPDALLDALEAHGFRTDGRLLALNSYENRVYQVGLEDAAPVVVKFYRPGRWTREAIEEEHAFARELAEVELPVVAPLADAEGRTLHAHGDFLFAVYPRCGGRWPDLASAEEQRRMGRLLGRMHAVGAARPFRHRPRIEPERLGHAARHYLLGHDFLPDYLVPAYASLTEDLLRQVEALFAAHGNAPLRLHGDCHPGNVLWTDDGPHFVDLDDCASGPAVQDLWMLVSGERDEMRRQLDELLEGYTVFHPFDPRSLGLIEALRTLRLMHYAAWLARRWQDPAFPRAFPWFGTPRYWEEHILTLREQAAAMAEPWA